MSIIFEWCVTIERGNVVLFESDCELEYQISIDSYNKEIVDYTLVSVIFYTKKEGYIVDEKSEPLLFAVIDDQLSKGDLRKLEEKIYETAVNNVDIEWEPE